MLIYKINLSLLTFFILTDLYFLRAWPKGACRMQTDRSTDRQTNKQTKSRTYAKNWRTIKQTISISYAKELAKYIFLYLLHFPYLFIFVCGRGLKGRAGCRQTEVQTDKQTDRLKTARGRGAPIPVLTPDAASIARPTASLPLCPLVIYA